MRPLPVGIDSFEKLIQENYYYIDKTLLIKELLELKGEVNQTFWQDAESEHVTVFF